MAIWIDNGRTYEGSLDADKGMVRLCFRVRDGWQEVKQVDLSRIVDSPFGDDRSIHDELLGRAECRLGSHEDGGWNLIVTVPRNWLTKEQKLAIKTREEVG